MSPSETPHPLKNNSFKVCTKSPDLFLKSEAQKILAHRGLEERLKDVVEELLSKETGYVKSNWKCILRRLM